MAMQVDDNGAECTAGVINADDKCEGVTNDEHDPADHDKSDPKMNMGGAGDCQSSCDWSQPSADDTVDGYGMKFFGEDLSQGIDADDERGDSSSSDDDWQEVEGLCELQSSVLGSVWRTDVKDLSY